MIFSALTPKTRVHATDASLDTAALYPCRQFKVYLSLELTVARTRSRTTAPHLFAYT